MATERSTSVQRAIAILETLGSPEATQRTGLGVLDVARLVGREKTQVSRTLKVLGEAGLVDRDPETLRYRLGWRLFALAAGAGEQRLRSVAPAVLRRLVASVKERAHLSVLEGQDVLTVLSESPPRAVQTIGWVGRVTPVYCTSSGRALLFDYSDEDVRDLLAGSDLSGGGPKAPRDVGDLVARLRRARARGFALVAEEFESDLVAAAAPVRDASGRVVAAVNVSAPKFRLGRELDAVGRKVRAAAEQVSRNLVAGEKTPTRGRDRGSPRAARTATGATNDRRLG